MDDVDDPLPPGDFDGAWKDALEFGFEPFMTLFFPAAHRDIDWSRGYEQLDKELAAITADQDVGRRVVDFLVKVWLNNGTETWLLIHIEIQSQPEAALDERMFVYNTRLYMIGRRPAASFAILADDNPRWRPGTFGYNRWGCELSFRFPVAKLIDLDRTALEASDNPFATVVLAHLEMLAAKNDGRARKESKFALVRRMVERGMEPAVVRRLFRVIDRMMRLSKALDGEFGIDLNKYEQERGMTYITSIERIGMTKGRRAAFAEAIERQLRRRFGDETPRLIAPLSTVDDKVDLNEVLDAAYESPTPADFAAALDRIKSAR